MQRVTASPGPSVNFHWHSLRLELFFLQHLHSASASSAQFSSLPLLSFPFSFLPFPVAHAVLEHSVCLSHPRLGLQASITTSGPQRCFFFFLFFNVEEHGPLSQNCLASHLGPGLLFYTASWPALLRSSPFIYGSTMYTPITLGG